MKEQQMLALKDFRIQQGDAVVWIKEGERYSTSSNLVSFHKKTGRGRPLTKKESDK